MKVCGLVSAASGTNENTNAVNKLYLSLTRGGVP